MKEIKKIDEGSQGLRMGDSGLKGAQEPGGVTRTFCILTAVVAT